MNGIESQFQALFSATSNPRLWQPGPEHYPALASLYEGICNGNQRLNLTRITNLEDFWEKHIWDAYGALALETIGEHLHRSQKVIDVGTGGGFPGLPLAIAFPHWQLTLLDATRKKINFLQELAQQLELDCHGIAERVETLGRDPQHRERYDIATIRAVGKAAICVEYLLPLLKVGGLAILYRGKWQDSDTEQLLPAIAQCSGDLRQVRAFRTPLTQQERTCLYIEKIQPSSSRFPRRVGLPKSAPLAGV